MCVCVCTYTHTHAHPHAHTHKNTHILTHTHIHTHSPATVRHRASCANVRNQTTGTAYAPRPLALLPRGAPLHGLFVACSVAPGRCFFVVAGFACLRRCACAPSDASVRQQMTGTACAPWPLVLESHGAPPRGPSLACSVAPGRCIFAFSNFRQLLANESVEIWSCSPATVQANVDF